MPITLHDDSPATYPVMRQTTMGETLRLAIIKTETRPRTRKNPATEKQEKIVGGENPDGSVWYKQEQIVHGLVMPGTTMKYKKEDEFIHPEHWERVRVFLKGKGKYEFRQAKKKLNATGTLSVGDEMVLMTSWAQKYDEDGKPKGEPITTGEELDRVPRGVTVGLYGPIELVQGTDPDAIKLAETAYLAEQEQKRIAAEAAQPAADREDEDYDELPY